MYRSIPGGAYYGMNLGQRGLGGLGDVPQPTTDTLAASWCAARGIPPAYCSIAPGIVDQSGALHIVSDPSGQPCIAGDLADTLAGKVNPCTWNDFGAVIPPAILEAQGITPGQYTCNDSQLQTYDGEQYAPLSCKGEVLLTQAQTLSLLAALGVNSPALQPVGTPASSTQGVYADPSTAQAIASQIVGGTVQPTGDGQYAVVAPGYATATPTVISQISSNPAPAGSSGSVPGSNFYPTPPVYTSTTPQTPTYSSTPTGTQQQQGGSSQIPPAGNAQATPPSGNFCFPGDTSAPSFIPGMCGNTAIGAVGILVLLVLVLKK